MSHDFTRPTQITTPNHANTAITLVAIYEIIKGAFALVFAGMIFLWHDHLPQIMHRITYRLHEALGEVMSQQIDNLNTFAVSANHNWAKAFWLVVAYALLRFVEAYGLYRDKIWAYWYSVLGYAIFIPVELYYLFTKPFDWVHLGVFLLNLLIVIVVYCNMHAKGLLSFGKH